MKIIIRQNNLPRPITKPAVQYAAHDFRNFARTEFGTEVSIDSFIVPVVVVRRAVLPNGALNKQKRKCFSLEENKTDFEISLFTFGQYYSP